MRLRRLKLEELLVDLPADVKEDAVRRADDHAKPVIAGLGYTESKWQYVVLRSHIAQGQIRPEFLRQLRRDDLEYLAGMTAINELESSKGATNRIAEMKVAENAVRATRELARRAQIRAELLVGGGVAAVGIVVAAIVGRY